MIHDNLPTAEVLVWPPPGPFAPRKIIVRPGHLRDKPRVTGWQAWEDPHVCPLFEERRQAIDYAIGRANGSSTLEVYDTAGVVLRSIAGAELAELAHEQAMRNHTTLAAMTTMGERRRPDVR